MFIVRKCPNISYCKHCKEWECERYLSGDNYEKYCKDNTGEQCKIKKLLDVVSEYYKTPEYFENLSKSSDRDAYICDSAFHNMAHLVICELGMEKLRLEKVE